MDFKLRSTRAVFDPSRTFVYPTSKAKSGIKLTKNIIGADETAKILVKLGEAITIYSARALALVAVDLLAKAQPRVPYDTGLLRSSGEATLKIGRTTEIIGVGKSDGTIAVWLGKINKAKLKGVRTLRADVSYKRIGDSGEDVAVWTHEQLWPYESRPRKPAARQPGTGPKYLEIPWLENIGNYINFLKSELSGVGFEKNIALISKLRQKRVGKYILNYIDLVPEQIASEGYFPPSLGYTRVGRRSVKWKANRR
uniref:Tail protein n=1 Tax=viral metagenome TaxID=1070528 RepID=A0A6H1ZW66_9ZZZZ